jgi:hypothetical protein
MRHTIHQEPVTHKFALIGLPPRLMDRDKLPIPHGVRWFNTREEAVATLPELLNLAE